MKVLTISTSDIEGGAARAAFRLHQGLKQMGVDSHMLVLNKNSDDTETEAASSKLFQAAGRLRLLSKPEQWISKYYLDGELIPFTYGFFSTKSILRDIERINPDVVHLHWFHNGFMNVKLLPKIKRPIVWSMHDMFAFTGGCHYDSECGKFMASCGACPILKSSNEKDISRKGFLRKQKAYDKTDNLTIIGLSKWLAENAKASPLLSGKRVENLPNCIDTTVYKPINKKFAREVLQLPQDKKLILFGAMNSTSDPRKGFHLLKDAVTKLSLSEETQDAELLIFGASRPKEGESLLPLKVHYSGRIFDDLSLSMLYSAADVMVVPSLQENLGNTIVEALACGTPVVGFDIGGNPDMIEHQKNGYLATAFDTDSLSEGISWIIKEDARHRELSLAARKKVLDTFSIEKVCTQYIELYSELASLPKPEHLNTSEGQYQSP